MLKAVLHGHIQTLLYSSDFYSVTSEAAVEACISHSEIVRCF